MKEDDFYTEAHLFVAAIRVTEHRKNTPPSMDEICELLSISLEQGHRISRKLTDLQIIKLADGTYGTRIFIHDHLKLEEIPRDEPEEKLEHELEKFQKSRNKNIKRIATIQAQQEDKKKNLFAELEKQLQQGMKKKP